MSTAIVGRVCSFVFWVSLVVPAIAGAAINGADVAAINGADVAAINGADVAAINGADVAAINGADVAAINGADVAAINGADVAAINGADVAAINGADVAAINGADVAAINGADVAAINGADVAAINGADVAAINGADVGVHAQLTIIGQATAFDHQQQIVSVLGRDVAVASSLNATVDVIGRQVAIYKHERADGDSHYELSLIGDADTLLTSFVSGEVESVDTRRGIALVEGVAVDYSAYLSLGYTPAVGDYLDVSGVDGIGGLIAVNESLN